MDKLAEQVQSLFYNNVHLNSINARMHTTLKCETPDGWSSDQIFKIDTGADGNFNAIQYVCKTLSKCELRCIE